MSKPSFAPVKLAPIPVARPWGGFALCERFRKPRPADGHPLGESWEASDLPGAVSRVDEGPLAGTPIDAFLGEPLPLLVKLIHATAWLSLQVHPDEAAASELSATHPVPLRPKHEAWHILWAEPGAQIVYGAKRGVTTPQLLDACRDGTVRGLLNYVRVHTGDTIYVPAGTVHAIGPGIVLYEVQTPSDVTFRLHDWGNVGLDGKPRALHLEEAAASIRPTEPGDPRKETQLTPGANPRILLLKADGFQLELFLVERGDRVVQERSTLTVVTVSAGTGWLLSEGGRSRLAAGDTLIIPREQDFALVPGDRGLRVLRAFPRKPKAEA